MKDNTIKTLVSLRKSLKAYLTPEILQKLAEFIEKTGNDNSMIERYVWFSENSEDGPDCRYAKMSKEFFEKEYAKGVAEVVIWLYHNWAVNYEHKE